MNPKPRTTNGLYRRNTEWSAVFRTDAVKAAELPLWLAGDSASVKVLIKYLCNLTALKTIPERLGLVFSSQSLGNLRHGSLTAHVTSESPVTKTAITGWVIFLSGSAIWLYGYFVAGHPSIIDWRAHTPWWIADFLPNLESELGILLCIAGIVPMYWPASESE